MVAVVAMIGQVKRSVARKTIVSDNQWNMTACTAPLDNATDININITGLSNLIVPVGCGQERTPGKHQRLYRAQLCVVVFHNDNDQ